MPKKPTATKPRKNYGISRIDQDTRSNHGWYVRIHCLRVAKFFSDSVWGGKRRAREAAENHRDLLMREMTPKQLERACKSLAK